MATRYRSTLPGLLPILFLVFSAPAAAQDVNSDELTRQTQNPISSLISVPFQGNWDFGIGDRDSSATLLNFQPVMPFAASPSTNVTVRVIIPLTSQPTATEQRNGGIGDTLATAFFSPSKSSKLIWGAGPAVLLPTATNAAIGSEKIALGPSIVVLKQPGNITYGFLGNQVWSVDGAKDREAVNQAFLQPFFNYNLGNGLSAGLTMEATVKWEASNGKATAPLIFIINKIAMLGKRPVNFQIGAGPMVASPDGGPKWRFRAAANFLYPR
jgi:hypothetical protein